MQVLERSNSSNWSTCLMECGCGERQALHRIVLRENDACRAYN